MQPALLPVCSVTAALTDTERTWKMSRITDIAKQMKSWWNEHDDPYVHRALDEIIRIDQEQASAIEPKRGEWIVKQSGFAECSVCEQYYFSDYNFCPNCGAKMKGADDD